MWACSSGGWRALQACALLCGRWILISSSKSSADALRLVLELSGHFSDERTWREAVLKSHLQRKPLSKTGQWVTCLIRARRLKSDEKLRLSYFLSIKLWGYRIKGKLLSSFSELRLFYLSNICNLYPLCPTCSKHVIGVTYFNLPTPDLEHFSHVDQWSECRFDMHLVS